jgi:hypothetical protein
VSFLSLTLTGLGPRTSPLPPPQQTLKPFRRHPHRIFTVEERKHPAIAGNRFKEET